ncbi:MAG: DUF6629 family protein [Cyanobium sp.]
MCFSAKASFLASALLLPTGTATLAMAWAKKQRQMVPLAAAPLLFGLQQFCEGMVWLGLEGQPPPLGQPMVAPVAAALAYLFFAYAFWPIWIPLAAVAQMPQAKGMEGHLWRGVPLLGLVPALLLWLPFLQHPSSALPTPIGHSLVYALNPWSASLLPPGVGPALYAALIVLPLLRVPSRRLHIFALTLLLTFGLSSWISRESLTSVWCYASALLSLQILWILGKTEDLPEKPGSNLALRF